MKISQLEQILEVARVGSISQAANNLYLSQPNLSLAIKRFEHDIGAEIFERTSTGVKLTRFGKKFVSYAQEIMLQVDSLERICRQTTSTIPLELSIASVGYFFLDALIVQAMKKYLGNPLHIRSIHAADKNLLDLVSNESVELGLYTVYAFARRAMMQQISIRNLEYHPLASVQAGIYVGVHNSVFTEKDKQVDFEKLSQLPMISIANGTITLQTVQDLLYREHDINLTCSTSIEVSSLGEAEEFMALTDGFEIGTFCPAIYEKVPFPGNLRFIPFPPGILTAELGWVQRNNVVRSPLANEVITLLREYTQTY